jgi:tetratricopeptide (TPR) repeat protein
MSVGPRGLKYTLGRRGTRATVGIPGTGLFYTQTNTKGNGSRSVKRDPIHARNERRKMPADQRLDLGFFKRLVTEDDEEALVDGCRALVSGSEAEASRHFRAARHLADGAFLAGMLELKKGQYSTAAECFHTALDKRRRLGKIFKKYDLDITINLPITDELSVNVGPTIRGVLLALVEAYQGQRDRSGALKALEHLRRLEPEDVVVKVSLAELLLANENNVSANRRVVRLANNVENESPIHSALILYRARALRRLGMYDAALDVLDRASRHKTDRPPELMKALRYERALIYESAGDKWKARREFERLYADSPDYEDVEERLGIT